MAGKIVMRWESASREAGERLANSHYLFGIGYIDLGPTCSVAFGSL
jgi:hypothetical protein